MKILIVDDDPIAVDLLSSCLRDAGHTDLTTAHSARDAEKIIRDEQKRFDTILLDILMPEKNGIELCADIRRIERYIHTPILMITQVKQRSYVEAAFQAGATDYVTKPFEQLEVVTRIRVAQRLVEERQAATDSYVAVKVEPAYRANSNPKAMLEYVSNAIETEDLALHDENVLPVYIFKNYLEQLMRADNCRVDVIAVRIENVAQHFQSLKAEDFVEFLRCFAEAVRSYSQDHKVFLTHIGNGTFLCAADQVQYGRPDIIEKGILECFAAHTAGHKGPLPATVQVSVGEPLQLLTSATPNFNRILKVSKTRVTMRQNRKLDQMVWQAPAEPAQEAQEAQEAI